MKLPGYTNKLPEIRWEAVSTFCLSSLFIWQIYYPSLAAGLYSNYGIFATCFAGILLFVFLFILLQYLQNRDRGYLYYSFYLAASLIYLLRANPDILWMFWGNKGLHRLWHWMDVFHE